MKPGGLVFVLLLCGGLAAAQDTARISGVLDWSRMEMSVRITLDLAGEGIRLPSGRARAEALIEDVFPALIQPLIMGIQVDSSSTVEDMISRGELSLRRADSFAGNARRIPPALSADLSAISAQYTLGLNSIGADFIRHSRPRPITAPMIPVPAREYTGIIIIADENLPVHGRSGSAFPQPCLFPKIWDSEMNLIFDRGMLDQRTGGDRAMVRYVGRESIMRSTPSALDEDLASLVGENPLRIMARGIFGVLPTDPVIDREDALLILSNETNRRLLREGRVALVIHREGLRKDLP
ncbi:MAG: polymerase [Treponema sp.]|jgi:hypothetical protein|nr:polymerase [Treponema sp.]